MALALAGFTIGMVEQYRKLADEAFERLLALSASCAFVYSFGCVPVAYGGDAARAIDWGERAIRLSPLDAMNYIPGDHKWPFCDRDRRSRQEDVGKGRTTLHVAVPFDKEDLLQLRCALAQSRIPRISGWTEPICES
jgi:hypothetical protein